MSGAIAVGQDFAQGIRWGRRVRRVARSGVVVGGALVALLVVGVAVSAPLVAPHAPDDPNFDLIEARPGPKAWFGTDRFGRDILSRVIYGSRISLYVAVVSIAASMVLAGRPPPPAGSPGRPGGQ